MAVILISHNLRDVFQVADNIAALYLGKMAAQIKTREVTNSAAIAGMLFASCQNSISPTTGGSATLLYAVGAAVIGGTSLFGGKGRMRDAVLGGFEVAIIDNGKGLLGYAAGIKFIVTRLVLLISSSVDALTRKKSFNWLILG